MEYIGERVSVMASFGAGYRIKPVKFKWTERVIDVLEVTYSWTDMEGSTKLYHFAVTDGCTVYELSFNSLSMLWVLEKVETQL